MSKEVKIIRAGNTIVVSPTTPRIEGLLAPQLTFVEKVHLQGKEYFQAVKQDRPTVTETEWECYTHDHRNRIATSFGFLPRIRRTLRESGYDVTVKVLQGHPRPEVFEPRWDRVEDEEFRHKQREVLEIIAKYENGRISCPTGWGKTYIIGQAARLFPRAKIAVVTRRVDILLPQIYPELCGMLPSVGIVGGGMKKKGRRVMCYTAGSIHHADGDEDFVFVDEGHEAAADDSSYKMAKFEHARIFMFSATWDMRLDNKDLRCEAMAGPIRIEVPYKEGVEHGMIVPIIVQMSDVRMDEDICAGLHKTDKERAGIWANDYRNDCIARDANLYDDDTQVLISVKTLEHALHLKKRLPNFELIYAEESQKPKDWRYFRGEGLIPRDFKILSSARAERLRHRFERNKLKKVIATPKWNVGVNMKHLQVIIRGDAGGSPINDSQIPGRGSRIMTITLKDGRKVKKTCAIVHDYLDQFNSSFSNKASRRVTSYHKQEWEVRMPNKKKKSALRQLMEWETV